MKVTRLFLGLLVVPNLWTCQLKEVGIQLDDSGVAIRLPYFWKTAVTDGTLAFGLAQGCMYDGGILCMGRHKSTKTDLYTQYGEPHLLYIDVATGQVRWQWYDKLDGQIEFAIKKSVAFYEQTMLVYNEPYQYGIDVRSGQTRWKLKRPNPNFGPIATQEGRYFFCGANNMAATQQDLVERSVYRGDIVTGSVEEVVKPAYSREFTYHSREKEIGTIVSVTPVVRGADTLLIVPHSEFGPRVPDYTSTDRSLFGLYNLTKRQWVYERIPLSSAEMGGTTALPPLVDKDRIYMSSLTNIGCFDLMTGKRIWFYRIAPVVSAFSDMILADGKLLANGFNAILYCLDPETGVTLWSQKSSGIGSNLYYHDGVVYYIASKNLLAVEVATGKLLWDLPCPDAQEENRPDSWFAGFVTGTPARNGEKGRIYATTNLNLYCFEAAR